MEQWIVGKLDVDIPFTKLAFALSVTFAPAAPSVAAGG